MKPSIFLTMLFMAALSVQAQNFDWMRACGSAGYDLLRNMEADADGNVYVALNFYEELILTDGTVPGNDEDANLAVIKYNEAGDEVMTIVDGGEADEYVFDMQVDHAGNIIVCGSFTGGDTELGGQVFSSAGSWGSYVVKYDPQGEMIWANVMAEPYVPEFYHMAVDDQNNVYIAGSFNGEFDFAGEHIITNGGNDAYFCKYSSDGDELWMHTLGSSAGYEGIDALAVDHTGDIIVAGLYDAEFYYDGVLFPMPVMTDAFVLKSNDEGEVEWTSFITSDMQEHEINDFAIGATNEIYFITTAPDNTLFGENVFHSSGDNDACVGKISTDNGSFEWLQNYGGDGADAGEAISLGKDAIFVSGSMRDNFYIGEFSLECDGIDALTLTLSYEDGALLDYEQLTGPNTQYATCISAGKHGDVYMAGHFYESCSNDDGDVVYGDDVNTDIYVTRYASEFVPVETIDPSATLLTIFPVPAVDQITIQYDGVENNMQMRITDVTGAVVMHELVNGNTMLVDIHHIPAGTYNISLHDSNGMATSASFIKL